MVDNINESNDINIYYSMNNMHGKKVPEAVVSNDGKAEETSSNVENKQIKVSKSSDGDALEISKTAMNVVNNASNVYKNDEVTKYTSKNSKILSQAAASSEIDEMTLKKSQMSKSTGTSGGT